MYQASKAAKKTWTIETPCSNATEATVLKAVDVCNNGALAHCPGINVSRWVAHVFSMFNDWSHIDEVAGMRWNMRFFISWLAHHVFASHCLNIHITIGKEECPSPPLLHA